MNWPGTCSSFGHFPFHLPNPFTDAFPIIPVWVGLISDIGSKNPATVSHDCDDRGRQGD